MPQNTNINQTVLVASPVGGAIAIIIVWLINSFAPGVEVPDYVAVAIGTVVTALSTWIAGRSIRPARDPDMIRRRSSRTARDG